MTLTVTPDEHLIIVMEEVSKLITLPLEKLPSALSSSSLNSNQKERLIKFLFLSGKREVVVSEINKINECYKQKFKAQIYRDLADKLDPPCKSAKNATDNKTVLEEDYFDSHTIYCSPQLKEFITRYYKVRTRYTVGQMCKKLNIFPVQMLQIDKCLSPVPEDLKNKFIHFMTTEFGTKFVEQFNNLTIKPSSQEQIL